MTSRGPGIRRRWIVFVVVLVLVIGAVILGNRAAPIHYYRVIDDHTVVVGTITGPLTWTRVTTVIETSSSVTVGVSWLSAPLAGFGDDLVELTVTLRDPIDDRIVVDASSGLPVPRQ